MQVSLALYNRCNHLYGYDEAHHGDGVDGGIGYAGDVAVHHGICGRQARGGRHAAGDGAQEVQDGNLEDEASDQDCHQHGDECQYGTDAEE